ncbi:MAG: fructose-6-phosphate aldolase [candidate division KSB1 bacterium]|nr:fructose-6-phosphate aldolase [candidate division KSB1 bacterium]MDZ7303148.1 fructose-6-phosphate aldolase [candidate division KSB1 bacterium]MDZ7310128.1 fructose-6-phosphate aldolase [candidate division KSB1 bacterium]
MKLFLDTANLEEIKKVAAMGLLDGVTTNPTLIAKEKGAFRDILRQICEVVPGPVNAEVISLDAEGMIREGRDLAKMHPNIVVKIPMTREGMVAVRKLSQEKIRTNVTLIFSPSQALLAAKAGASFVSPFLGRLDDISHIGMDLVRQIVAIYDNYEFETEVLAASLRHPVHVVEAALAGADIATIPAKVFDQLFQHPLTDIGITRFLEDWQKAKQSL